MAIVFQSTMAKLCNYLTIPYAEIKKKRQINLTLFEKITFTVQLQPASEQSLRRFQF